MPRRLPVIPVRPSDRASRRESPVGLLSWATPASGQRRRRPAFIRGAAGAGLFATVLGVGAASRLAAQATEPSPPRRDSSKLHALDTVAVVTGRLEDLHGIATSASEGRVGAVDLRLRPITREGELLETAPGVIVTQHSGEGKANQYFVRGFNLDHGTDFETTVDGMPINMRSHAHGQGYTDLNFLIPESVDHLDYRLGVYYPEVGDFGSAGGADFHLARSLARPFATVSTGVNGLARVAAGGSGEVGGGDLLAAGEVKGYDGPWRLAEKERKFSGVARYSWQAGSSQFSVLGMGYHNKWRSNDQIPLRAVQTGLIGRFQQIDTTDGGNTERYSLSGSWHHAGRHSAQDVQLFGIYSDLSLFSDFTYFLDNPVQGDQFNQREHRVIVGGRGTQVKPVAAFGVQHVLTAGVEGRGDIINGLGLYHTKDQIRFGTTRRDDVREWSSGVFGKLESQWLPWFRSVLGLRGDLYSFNVASDIPENAGSRGAGIVSPKASLVFAPSRATELYVSGGLGFHSNDARGTTIVADPATRQPVQRVDPLVRSRGAEVGARVTPVQGWRSTLSLWALNLDSELLFSGDGGTTSPSAASRRRGVTWANFYRPIPELSLDADVSFARARFAGVPANQVYIPGALENVVATGITWMPEQRGVFGSVRIRHFGSYPLIETDSVRAKAATLVSADAGYLLLTGLRLQITMLNILNARADDIQYFYASRLRGEPTTGVGDLHFHPVEPRQIRVSVAWGL